LDDDDDDDEEEDDEEEDGGCAPVPERGTLVLVRERDEVPCIRLSLWSAIEGAEEDGCDGETVTRGLGRINEGEEEEEGEEGGIHFLAMIACSRRE